MSGPPREFLGRAIAAPPARPKVDGAKARVYSCIASPEPDRQGDELDTAGGDWESYRANPIVCLDHRRTGWTLPIGLASDESGRLTVERKGGRIYSWTRFDTGCPVAMQVLGAIDRGFMKGTSISFDAVPGEYEQTGVGVNPLTGEKRPKFRFYRWKPLEYSHTALGVNRDALTVAVEKGLIGGEPIGPALKAALLPYCLTNRPPVARGATLEKAMPDTIPDTTAAPATDPAADDVLDEEPEEEGKPLKHSAQHLCDWLQQLDDMLADRGADAEMLDNEKVKPLVDHALEVLTNLREEMAGGLQDAHPDVDVPEPVDKADGGMKDDEKEAYPDEPAIMKAVLPGLKLPGKYRAKRLLPYRPGRNQRQADGKLTPGQEAALDKQLRRIERALAYRGR